MRVWRRRRSPVAESAARMKFLMHGFEPRVLDVRVDLRRGNARVSQHFLQRSDLGSAGEQMRREARTAAWGFDD